MSNEAKRPVACTLTAGDYRERIAWIRELTREALIHAERHGLTLTLTYAPEAAPLVRQMVRQEQACCSFLTFEVLDAQQAMQVTVTAPEHAQDAADVLFEQFMDSSLPSR